MSETWPAKHFSLAELTRSDTARKLGVSNEPVGQHLKNLKRTAVCLEDARAIIGRPLHVTNAYRAPRVNKAVGGTPTSAHPLGYAADVHCDGLTPLELAHALRDGGLAVDQAIVEADRGVLHLSFDPRFRMQWGVQHGGPGSPITWRLPA